MAHEAVCLFVPAPHCANRPPPGVVGDRVDGVGVTLAIKGITYIAIYRPIATNTHHQ